MGKIEKKRNAIQRRLKLQKEEKSKALKMRKLQEQDETRENSLGVQKHSIHKTHSSSHITRIEKQQPKRSQKKKRKRNGDVDNGLLKIERVDFGERTSEPPALNFQGKKLSNSRK